MHQFLVKASGLGSDERSKLLVSEIGEEPGSHVRWHHFVTQSADQHHMRIAAAAQFDMTDT
ncbi:hypothetical protein [Stenotrophomonas rhizophila]